jgi:hypothetical protein
MAEDKSTTAGPKPAKTTEPATAPEPKPEPQPEAKPQSVPERPFISEGVRDEIERTGQALDPATGRVLTREDLP